MGMSLTQFLPLLITAAVIIAVVGLVVRRARARPALICTACGARAGTRSATRGSILIEILLWLALLIPGLIYSLWRLTTRRQVCRACGSPDLIPIASPRGRQLLAEQSD